MNIFKNIISGLVIGTLIMFGSCTNLDENPYTTIVDGNIDVNDPSILADFMGKAYIQLQDFYWPWDSYWDASEEGGDLLCTPVRLGVGWGGGYVLHHKHTWETMAPGVNNAYSRCITGILYANKCLDILPESETGKRAEMRFLRAFFYYIAFDFFRNPPFIDTMEFEDQWLPSQLGPEEMFNWIVKELVEIKDALGTEKRYGYPNRYVADMVLAKLYLNRNAYFRGIAPADNSWYEKALAEVNDVIDNGGYTLATHYLDNNKDDHSSNPECIMGIPVNPLARIYGNYNDRKAHHSAAKAVYGFTGAAPYNGSGALPQFIMSYSPDDKRLGWTWAGGVQHEATVVNGETVPNSGAPIKPASGTFADDWTGENVLNYNIEMHSIDNPGSYQMEGYRYQKDYIVPGSRGTASNDINFFRLGDAMFIKAECLLRLGRDKQTAADLITAVRMRSFDDPEKAKRTVADLEGPSVYPYGVRECTSVGFNNWETWIDIPEGGDDIILGGLLDDLAWEFVGEHHRRQDLIRFELTDGRSVWIGKSRFSMRAHNEQRREYYGFSASILRNNLNLKQTKGYPDQDGNIASSW
ncbi:hypothetical protein M2137_000428 [Parabacteroides sp. PFB2-10]|uniref:RagB/SusD family nutrient uptake outer membrane protein n=1 Tax=Parabacteroides sp. PFB2-10 TaxID=1742405 RepID=UPI0024749FF9|nr:RagB/SusD family nutrient uptake outer membrane protein [Parabacteroides sp. PFB2-10]MDH6311669.1 hypothetical protein [Parabacteroides sp. PFB2-10]